MPDRSYGSVLVTEMVWIRPRGRVDSEMGIKVERWVYRESNESEKMGGERERAYV